MELFMNYKDKAKTLWETSKIHGMSFDSILKHLEYSDEQIDNIRTEMEILEETVEYPYHIEAGKHIIVLNEDGPTEHLDNKNWDGNEGFKLEDK